MATEFDEESEITGVRPPASGNGNQRAGGWSSADGPSRNSSEHGALGAAESCGSLSSGFSTPVGSDLCSSTETTCSSTDHENGDDADFIAQLTLQMADYMLLEDNNDDDSTSPNSETIEYSGTWSYRNFSSKYGHHAQGHSTTFLNPNSLLAHVKNPSGGTGFFSTHTFTDEQLKDERMRGNREARGRREKGAESSKGGQQQQQQQQQVPRRKQSQQQVHRPTQNATGWSSSGLRSRPIGSGQFRSGSGMRAVFLGGSPSSSGGSAGTGVFLPCVPGTTGAVPHKKPGRSTTVLIPTRVLQALDLHFSQTGARSLSSNASTSPHHDKKSGVLLQKQEEKQEAVGHHQIEAELPQEWTY